MPRGTVHSVLKSPPADAAKPGLHLQGRSGSRRATAILDPAGEWRVAKVGGSGLNSIVPLPPSAGASVTATSRTAAAPRQPQRTVNPLTARRARSPCGESSNGRLPAVCSRFVVAAGVAGGFKRCPE
jgi:hypothetical protein